MFGKEFDFLKVEPFQHLYQLYYHLEVLTYLVSQ